MNQTSQYIFNLYHYLLNLRDTMEFTINREHSKAMYDQRKMVLTKGIMPGSALGNFLENNKETGDKIREKIDEFLKEVYGDDSTILVVSGETVRVDHTQHLKIFDYVVGLTESIRDIIFGYLAYAKSKGEEDIEIAKLLILDDRLYRTVLAMLVFRDFEKSFGEFQKVMAESQGKPTPQSNFIVQNEIMKYSSFLRFSRDHHKCTDTDTLELLDDINAVIEMTEGRRDRKNDKSFKELFEGIDERIKTRVGIVEQEWKETFEKLLKEFMESQKAAQEEAQKKIEA